MLAASAIMEEFVGGKSTAKKRWNERKFMKFNNTIYDA